MASSKISPCFSAGTLRLTRYTPNSTDLTAHEYHFEQNVVDCLESVWDYEIKGYVGAEELNTSKRRVIQRLFKDEPTKHCKTLDESLRFVDLAAENVITRLSCGDGIVTLIP